MDGLLIMLQIIPRLSLSKTQSSSINDGARRAFEHADHPSMVRNNGPAYAAAAAAIVGKRAENGKRSVGLCFLLIPN